MLQLLAWMPTRNRNISLRALRTFCAAARHESFREAAQELFLTDSAVSHQIKQLETELGARLFQRASRSLSLTQAGDALYADLQPVLEQLDQVVADHASQDERTSVSISVKPFFASEVFVPRLQSFSTQHPDLDIKVDTNNIAKEAADLSIRVFDKPPKNLLCDKLFAIRLVPVSSVGFYDSIKIRAGKIVSDFPVIIHDGRPHAWRQWQRSSRIRLPQNNKILRMDSMISVARAAERGMGAALIPIELASSWLQSQSLVQLFDHELHTDDSYYLVRHGESPKSSAVQAFRDWVLDEFQLDR